MNLRITILGTIELFLNETRKINGISKVKQKFKRKLSIKLFCRAVFYRFWGCEMSKESFGAVHKLQAKRSNFKHKNFFACFGKVKNS